MHIDALPYELLSAIVEDVVRDYLFEYFTSHGTPLPWNAISSLNSVSVVMRAVVHTLLSSSALSIPRLEDGRLSIDPLVALTLARAESQMSEDILYGPRPGTTYDLTGASHHEDRKDSEEHSRWKDSPLLELYSVIRETRFKSDFILQRSSSVVQLIVLPLALQVPMEKVSALKDNRLVWPALMEGGRLMACTSFISRLAGCAGYLTLFQSGPPLDVGYEELYYKIDEQVSQMEALEKDCQLLPPSLRWLQIERQAIVNPLNIYISGIVPALSDFLNKPVVISDPRCEQWRRSGDLLLQAWAPLDDEIRRNPPNDPESPVYWRYRVSTWPS